MEHEKKERSLAVIVAYAVVIFLVVASLFIMSMNSGVPPPPPGKPIAPGALQVVRATSDPIDPLRSRGVSQMTHLKQGVVTVSETRRSFLQIFTPSMRYMMYGLLGVLLSAAAVYLRIFA